MRHYYLGLGADLSTRELVRHTLTIGREADRERLAAYLADRYGGEAILTKNGRSALALALKAYFRPGEAVLVNGFTCYAVYEACQAAGVIPVWVDISRETLNFTSKTLAAAWRRAPAARGLIVQNSLGHPVEIEEIERFCQRHQLVLIEDLAHSVGFCYPDGRETGTVGAATVLSFGKDKVIDATSGGALVLRDARYSVGGEKASRNSVRSGSAKATRGTLATPVKAPSWRPQTADNLRARFYPLLGLMTRGLTHLHLGGVFMRFCQKTHLVERSADNRLSFTRKIAKFEAKLALEQLQQGRDLVQRAQEVGAVGTTEKATGAHRAIGEAGTARPLRTFYLVKDRVQVLEQLRKQGYYFDGFWYEKPVSPTRYYEKVQFPETDCPVATEVAREIINFPNYYSAAELAPARKIVDASTISEAKIGRTAKKPARTAKTRPATGTRKATQMDRAAKVRHKGRRSR